MCGCVDRLTTPGCAATDPCRSRGNAAGDCCGKESPALLHVVVPAKAGTQWLCCGCLAPRHGAEKATSLDPRLRGDDGRVFNRRRAGIPAHAVHCSSADAGLQVAAAAVERVAAAAVEVAGRDVAHHHCKAGATSLDPRLRGDDGRVFSRRCARIPTHAVQCSSADAGRQVAAAAVEQVAAAKVEAAGWDVKRIASSPPLTCAVVPAQAGTQGLWLSLPGFAHDQCKAGATSLDLRLRGDNGRGAHS